MKSNTTKGVLLAILAGICWGFSGTVGQYLFMAKGMDSGWLTTVRLVFSGIILLSISSLWHPDMFFDVWKKKRDRLHLIAFSIFGLMMVQYGYMQAIYYSNSGTATAIQYTGEAMVLVYTCLAYRRLPKLSEMLGLFMALFGIFLLATHGDVHNMTLSPGGLIWGLVAAAALTVYTVMPGKLIIEHGSLVVTGYGMLIGGIVLAILLRFWNLHGIYDIGAMLGLAAIILVGTVAGFSIYLKSTVMIGPLKAGLMAAIETVAAPFFSRIWLKTQFEMIDYVGFLCILAMVVLLALPELLKHPKDA